MIYRACSQLLKKHPVFLSIFRRREIHTMFVTQLRFAETQDRAKGRIHEKRLAIQALYRDPDGTRVENITKKLNVGAGRYAFCHEQDSQAVGFGELYSTAELQ